MSRAVPIAPNMSSRTFLKRSEVWASVLYVVHSGAAMPEVTKIMVLLYSGTSNW